MGFGNFDWICERSALPLCYVLGNPTEFTSAHNPVLLPACSARSIELANTIIFQAATDFAHIAALGMTAIMIFHVRSKFTAVGRKEILTFFYIYTLLTIISLVLDAGVIHATNTTAYPWFVAVQNGLASALCTSLLINGFVGFQLYEDGTTLSVWLLRLCSLVMFIISFAVSLLTFKGWAGLSPTNTTGLFVVLYIINAVFLAIYFVMQVMLVLNTLQDRWPLGDLAFGAFFFVIGQVILYVFGKQICEGANHYLDSLFFATVCNLLAVMMIYKYWDSITKEDLEFSVGTKQGHWDVKEPLMEPSEDYRTSIYGGLGGGRESVYDMHGMDYQSQSAALRAPSRDRASMYGNLPEGRQSYGDIRRHTGTFEDYEPQASRQRSREKDYGY
ncbi:Chitin synthase export chaperone [Exophiala dermatitidis]